MLDPFAITLVAPSFASSSEVALLDWPAGERSREPGECAKEEELKII